MSENYPYGIADVHMPTGAIHRVPVQNINQIRELYCWQVYNSHMKIKDLKGKTVFDIGAMAGVYSIMAAVAGAKKVIAVEPNKANYALLSENIILNGLTTIESIPMIISDQNKAEMKLFINTNPGAHSISLEHVESGGARWVDSDGERITLFENVPSITLDSLAKELNIIPDFVKMDIEGAEYLAMCGAADLLTRGHTEFAIATYHGKQIHNHVLDVFERFDYIIEVKGPGGGPPSNRQGGRFVYAWKP